MRVERIEHINISKAIEYVRIDKIGPKHLRKA